MPAPTDAASPTRNVGQLALRGEGRGEQRRQRRHGTVHQSHQPRLNDLEQEELPGGFRLGLLLARRLPGGIELAGKDFVPPLGLGQIAQQLARFGVGGPLDRPVVEPLRLQFHQRHLARARVARPRADRLQRVAAHEAPHVFPLQQGNLRAVLVPEQLHQPVPVRVLLLTHGIEVLGRPGIIRPQPPGELAQQPAIFLFQRNGQRQYLGRRQVFETAFHGTTPFSRSSYPDGTKKSTPP